MRFWVRSGPGYHAGEEFHAWLKQPFDESHATAVVQCLYELLDVARLGFAARRMVWQAQGFGEIWIFEYRCFRVALRVPGDGRADTSDGCLVASEPFSEGGQTTTFHNIVRWRLQNGQEIEWQL